MTRERLADAYEEQAALFARLADATAQIAHELRGIEPAAARAAVSDAEGAQADPPQPPPHPTDIQEQHVATVLGQCPDHQVPWTVRPAGVSSAGKSYTAFWRCDQRQGDGWCKKRPVKAWVDSHPIREAA